MSESSNPVSTLRKWLQEQWKRIVPIPHAQAGSYYRGYQNGMADILRGLQAQLYRFPDETAAPRPHGVVYDKPGWVCSVCGFWNNIKDRHCAGTHLESASAESE